MKKKLLAKVLKNTKQTDYMLGLFSPNTNNIDLCMYIDICIRLENQYNFINGFYNL